jgi:hypothetical protein
MEEVSFQQALNVKSSTHLNLVILSIRMPSCYDPSRLLRFYKDTQGIELNAAILHPVYRHRMELSGYHFQVNNRMSIPHCLL